jgi:hypothetical protein
VERRPDHDLVEVDELSRHYEGQPYRDREFRGIVVLVEVDRWHAFGLTPG